MLKTALEGGLDCCGPGKWLPLPLNQGTAVSLRTDGNTNAKKLQDRSGKAWEGKGREGKGRKGKGRYGTHIHTPGARTR